MKIVPFPKLEEGVLRVVKEIRDIGRKLLEDEDEERKIYEGSWLEASCLGVKVQQGDEVQVGA